MFTFVKYGMFTFVNMENYQEYLEALLSDYEKLKEEKLQGRYVTLKHIRPLLKKMDGNHFKIEKIGESVLGKPIYSIQLGSGNIKILGWSQMHGNESTTTKAVFDLVNALSLSKGKNALTNFILEHCRLQIIPMLNPDGAEAYTRVNANNIDLNRDADRLHEPESRVLRGCYEAFKPDFCLNLHDQRTIFSAGAINNPATLSFLTPSRDKERSVTPDRAASMKVVSAIVEDLQPELSGKIGRYDDAYNINCTGDTFQTLGVPTILFEAGHYPGDYKRDETRKYVYKALLSAIYHISAFDYKKMDFQKYFEIPENEKLFRDIILRNVSLEEGVMDVVVHYKEELKSGRLNFVPVVEEIEEKSEKFGHREIDCKGSKIKIQGRKKLGENVVVNKIVLNGEILTLKCG